ncbi:MAG: gamma-glutamyl-gamma-aminobutyrate hydrolase family protein [Lachnospiraceae bacterium]
MTDVPHVLVAGHRNQTIAYCHALQNAGVMPEPLEESSVSINTYTGLLLPGGGDIAPSLFHCDNLGSRNIDIDLDKQQFALLDAFVQAQKPILGICKGLQLINLYFNGTLIQDLPNAPLHAWDLTDSTHLTHATPGSFIDLLYGRAMITNSAHHQGVGAPGKGIHIVQLSTPDHVVEAICHASLPIIALQWHPERLFCPDGSLIFRHFASMCQVFILKSFS